MLSRGKKDMIWRAFRTAKREETAPAANAWKKMLPPMEAPKITPTVSEIVSRAARLSLSKLRNSLTFP